VSNRPRCHDDHRHGTGVALAMLWRANQSQEPLPKKEAVSVHGSADHARGSEPCPGRSVPPTPIGRETEHAADRRLEILDE
jgi:hypothetical protein